MQEITVWEFVKKRLRSGAKVILLIVVESKGSSPGRVGFKMAVDEKGALCGSIGGGIMEVKLVELARDRLKKGEQEVLLKKQIHRQTARRDRSGMICSGEQHVAFVYLTPAQLPVIRQITGALKKNRPAMLRLSKQEFSLAFTTGTSLPAFRFEIYPAGAFFYEEQLACRHRLYIIGGGHCALALSEIMSKLDFYICLFDDRPGLNTLNANRYVQEKHRLEDYEQIDRFIPAGDTVYVVVMTLGYRSDEIVIRRLLDKNWKYFGVLGSAAKMKLLLEKLRQEGFSAKKLEQIHTPVGLPIRSRTPAEIAVSIAAEIISIKNSPT